MSFLSSKKIKTIFKILKYIVAILAFYLVSRSVDWSLFMQTVTNFNLYLLIPITILYFIGIGLSCLRWQFILRTLEIELKITELIKLYLVGNFYNTFLPSSVGGDVVKVLKTDKSLSRKKVALSVFLDRVYGLITSLFFSSVIGIFYFFFVERIRVVFLTSLVFLVIVIVFISVLLFRSIWEKLLDVVDSRVKIPFVQKATITLRKLVVYLPKSFAGILYSVSLVISVFASQYLLFHASSVDISILEVSFANPAISLISMVPISISAIGIKEGAYSFYYSLFGVSSSQAVAVSIVGRVLLILNSLVGIFFI